ncbi:efflux transporter outer membrane subunit [Novosphingobium terrae]|uniref:efflux transporter outer membrane subunit n=1 Tax=Novosphingobium terrae TaxID=2726189 RepID=UPI001F13404A|nr:TolC family protein [Novosphingobium terrae]
MMRAYTMRGAGFSLSLAALLLSGCNMAPKYVRPTAPVAEQWPGGAAYPAPDQSGSKAGLTWQQLITNPKLQQVITQMLANNRDLRVAVANVVAARATYRADRAAIFPVIGATATGSRTGGSSAGSTTGGSYNQVNLGVSSFEIDLWGRLRNQASAGFETYLSTQSGMRSTKLSLVQETALAYVTLASDEDLLKIAKDTAASAKRSLDLTQSLLDAGLGNAPDVESAKTVLATAESDVASNTTQVAQDRNALDLLVGAHVDEALLPTSLADIDGSIALVPAGLSSTVLLQRPDVVEAEHTLKGANYSIGAARAAFFPTISLTAAGGFASTALSSLFNSGSKGWSVSPTASLPLIGGTRFADLDKAKATRDADVASYEKALQTAFRDVADALARRGTIEDQRAAQGRLVTASQRSLTLSDAQYQAGTAAYINVLTAQRTLYSARQTQVSATLADLSNRLSLYTAIGADDTL